MDLNELLASSTEATGQHGSLGVESDWQVLAPFTLRGQHLQMVEKRIIGVSGPDTIIVPAPPGEHVVESKVVTYGGVDSRISRMRVRRLGATPALGRLLGKISVDLGGIAVADIDVLGPSVEENEEEHEEWIEAALYESDERVGVLVWEPGQTTVPFADGGFGDGAYPVHELVESGEVVGLEAVFIPVGTPYLFGK